MIDALVVVTVVHPVQLLAVHITMMSSLYAVSVHCFWGNYFIHMYIGQQYSSTRYTTTLSTCSELS